MSDAVALLGEIEENPLVLGMEDLAERLSRSLEDLNRSYRPMFLAPLVTAGDVPEFMAVLTDLGAAYPIARHLAEAVHPLPVRIAACRGAVHLSAETPTADQIDGPAFDTAAELLYRARKEDRFLVIRDDPTGIDPLANVIFLLLYRDLQRWTERQCEVVRLYRRFGRQQDVARHLGVSQQAVSSSLAAARWKDLAETEAVLGAVLGFPEPYPSEPRSENPIRSS